MKTFVEVILVSLTLRARTLLKIFEIMQAISLYWFAAQHETSTLTNQKLGIFKKIIVQNLMKLAFLKKSTGRGKKHGLNQSSPKER